MRLIAPLLLLVGFVASCASTDTAPAAPVSNKAVLVVHGGAGTIERADMTPEREARYRAKLEEALRAGYAVLDEGGSSLDAVEATIVVLEASPLFNAGVGAVFTNEGTVEHDASIMAGIDRSAGAVAGVMTVKSPIRAARAVMERSKHVMLSGRGAEAFAEECGLEIVPNDYFQTDWRREQLERLQEHEASAGARLDGYDRELELAILDRKYGTVGAVALDRTGHLAAATSTGGMTNKRWGRIGDSPIIGAGTWADDATCGVSATGHGEYFIRAGVAQDIANRMAYQGLDVGTAARTVIHDTLARMGGTGGVIALDGHGNFAMPFNTSGMYRGWVDRNGNVTVAIYGDE